MTPPRRYRKPISVTLDPRLLKYMRDWCESQEFYTPLARALDVAIEEFLERRLQAKPEDGPNEELLRELTETSKV